MCVLLVCCSQCADLLVRTARWSFDAMVQPGEGNNLCQLQTVNISGFDDNGWQEGKGLA